MSSTSYFAPAFKPTSAVTSARPSSSGLSRKRKRGTTPSEDENDSLKLDESARFDVSVESAVYTNVTSSVQGLGQNHLDESFVDQCKTAGQLLDEDLPKKNFPHRSTVYNTSRKTSNATTASEIPTRIDQLESSGLRRQHVGNIIVIIHRCVLEGDYIRAGRAFGMLLRVEHLGHSLDLRINDRWGLGAEILLQREERESRSDGRTSLYTDNDHESRQHDGRLTTRYFKQAINYYERLALDYPYRKTSPNSIGSQDFNFAIFGLWIKSVEEQHSSKLNEIENLDNSIESSRDNRGDESGSPSVRESKLDRHQRIQQVRENTLRRAKKIGDELRELLRSPPYVDSGRYRELRRMVNVWISDLSLPTAVEHNEPATKHNLESTRSDDSSASEEERSTPSGYGNG